MRAVVDLGGCRSKLVSVLYEKLMYVSRAHRFSTVVAQATMNRPVPIEVAVRVQTTTSGSSCHSQDMPQKTRYVACGLMRVVIACKDRTRVRLRLRFAPCETYRSYRDKNGKDRRVISRDLNRY